MDTADMKLAEIADQLHKDGIFTGGPPALFESGGRLQLSTLVREGIYPSSKLLDVGCGCLRAGYWLVHFLDADCYFGIEPNTRMLQAGIDAVLGPELQKAKRPCFDTNDQFDFSIFGAKFDVVLARSIWTHASKPQIQTMLDGFVQNSNPNAFFLTSYHPASWFGPGGADYTGTRWVGRSHTSTSGGLIRHKRNWIESQCRTRGLSCVQLDDPPFNGQYWLKIARKFSR
jgi:hypothetical protein